MTIDTERLRKFAEAATPGPWSVGDDEHECAATLRAQPIRKTDGMPSGDPVEVIIPFGRAYSDAAFIAAANPQTVIALLDDNAQLREACATWQNHFTDMPGLAAANAEIVSLRSQLATVTAARDEACDGWRRALDAICDVDQALYDRVSELLTVGA